MALEPVTAICDACILYLFHLRNILVQISVDGLYQARWTEEIHDESTRSLLGNIPAIPPERLENTRRLMETALPDARIDGYQHHIDKLALPDPDDRHVAAAALEAKASRVLTWNLRDFSAGALKKLACPRAFFVMTRSVLSRSTLQTIFSGSKRSIWPVRALSSLERSALFRSKIRAARGIICFGGSVVPDKMAPIKAQKYSSSFEKLSLQGVHTGTTGDFPDRVHGAAPWRGRGPGCLPVDAGAVQSPVREVQEGAHRSYVFFPQRAALPAKRLEPYHRMIPVDSTNLSPRVQRGGGDG